MLVPTRLDVPLGWSSNTRQVKSARRPEFESLETRLLLTGLYTDRAQFLNDPQVGPTTAIDFDTLPVGTDLTNITKSGVRLEAPGSGPLLVTAAAAGIRNSLSTSSSPNVLSPGGSNTSLEDDDLRLVFAIPARSAGLDVVFDVPDGASFVRVTFLDSTGAVLASQDPIPAPSGSPGYQFIGYVSSLANIKTVLIDEFDPTANDDNVAYDSLIISATSASETEPNNELASATVLPFMEDPAGSGFLTSAIALGVMDPAGDNDYWSFSAKAGDRLEFELERTGADGQRIIISNAAGGTIFDSTNGSYSWFGSPPKTTPPPVAIPADGSYYARILNWPGYSGVWSYKLRVDLARSVQLEPYDWNFYNNDLNNAGNAPINLLPGVSGHLVASVAGSLYSQEGVDYYPLGRLDPGNQVVVNSRTITVSGLTYKVQVVGKTVGLLPDADGSQLDAQATATIGQNDDYFVKVEAISGVGIRGQYLIDIDVQDAVPPKITSVSGIPAEAGTIGLYLNPITLNFSEDLETAGVNAAATYEMRSAGPDDTFGSGDDVVYMLTASGGSRSMSLRVTDGPPQPGAYRFTAHASGLLDRFGNPLDGNGDGTGGDDLVHSFSVVIPADQVVENRSNDSIPAATPLPFMENPAGSGFLTSAIALGVIDPAGDNDYWSFSAQAGDRLGFELEHTGGDGPRIIISNAAGGTIFDSTNGSYSWFGSPPKTTPPPVAIPADGSYYARILNWPGYSGVWSYKLRVDLARSVQLEPYDWNFYNNAISGASNFSLTVSGDQRYGTLAGSLYSQEGVDFYKIGTVNPGETIFVSTRLPSTSTLSPAVEVQDERGFYWNERSGNRSFDGVAEVPVNETHTFYVLMRPNSGVGIRGQYLLDVQVVQTGSLDFPDLVATAVSGPSNAQSGESISVSWTVQNIGHATTLVSSLLERSNLHLPRRHPRQ